MPGEKRFWDAVPACILLRKNFWNGVLARSITKIPLVLPHEKYPNVKTFRKCQISSRVRNRN
jgi:hypothetical protein